MFDRFMRNHLPGILNAFGAFLTGLVSFGFALSLISHQFLNYREQSIPDWFYSWGTTALALWFFGIYLVVLLVQSRRRNTLRRSICKILFPSAIALALILVNHNGFPGVTAPVELRQRWALKEFVNYDGVVKSIQNCRSIVERVGTVQAVAPTQGKNFVISDPGSSGHSGELTLEVVGTKGTGVANFKFHIDTSVSSVDFAYQNKTETLVCWK